LFVQGGREGDERSSIFGELLTAEETARAKKAGIHSGKEPPPLRINDCSLPGSAARARQYLPFLQRQGTTSAVVEAVLSGSRLKIYVPKDSVVLLFSPSWVKTPSRGVPARGSLPAVAPEPFGEEAFQFVRENFLQRDVSVAVQGIDKAGTLLGSLRAGALQSVIPKPSKVYVVFGCTFPAVACVQL
jgi:staphylococcal nuclease domain-containing protein 1